MTRRLLSVTVVLGSLAMPLSVSTEARAATFIPIAKGDIIASVALIAAGNEQVNEYTPSGTLVQTLIDHAALPSGSAFDRAGNLYVTEAAGNDILKVDAATGAVSVFSNDSTLADGTTFNNPNSIAFGPGYARMYVSDIGYHGGIHVIDTATGKGVGFFPVPSSNGSNESGSGEPFFLAFDPSGTLYMTNSNALQGVMRVDQRTGDIEQPSFVPNLPDYGFSMSFDPNGDLWLAARSLLLEYGPTGILLRSITNPGFSYIYATAFNPTFNTLYAGDTDTGTIYAYDVNGTVTNTFSAGDSVMGLSVAGTIIAPAGGGASSISLAPLSATSPIGSPVILTAHVTDVSGNPVSGVPVTFDVVLGPDADGGFIPPVTRTDASGHARVILPGDTAGTDVADAYFSSGSNAVISSFAHITFVAQSGDLSAKASELQRTVGQHVDSAVLATFKDSSDGTRRARPGDFSARINWGDPNFHSISAIVNSTPSGFQVRPSVPHTFCSAGTYNFSITILDKIDQESIVVDGTTTEKTSARSRDQCAFGEVLFSTGSTPQDLNGRGIHACSGTMVNSASGLMVITAAHCLDFASDGSVADHIAGFIPAVYSPLDGTQPFGIWTSTHIFADPLYSYGQNRTFDPTYDYAFVRLNPSSCFVVGHGQCPKPASNVAGFLGGGLPIHWNPPRGSGYFVYDPAASPSSCQPSFSNNDSLGGSGPDLFVEECKMSDNSAQVPVSGSPWIDSRGGIVSVTSKTASFSYLPNPIPRKSLWGTYLGDQARSDFGSG
jgi:hypothetical protein